MMKGASGLRAWANRWLFGDVKRAIVVGNSYRQVFKGFISQEKVVPVRNYVTDDLIIPRARLTKKMSGSGPKRILFLSNLIPEKGYLILLNAFLSLRRKNLLPGVELHFAGVFQSKEMERTFCQLIYGNSLIRYRGVVRGIMKRNLLWGSHVFCLPTMYRYEAQPLSILEAYAAGCTVLTTNIGGIKDVFKDRVNGLFIGRKKSIRERDVAKGLMWAFSSTAQLSRIARRNRSEVVKQYRLKRFCRAVEASFLADD
jgi:glycosyltransferase involved in cell wall biosynthesis